MDKAKQIAQFLLETFVAPPPNSILCSQCKEAWIKAEHICCPLCGYKKERQKEG